MRFRALTYGLLWDVSCVVKTALLFVRCTFLFRT